MTTKRTTSAPPPRPSQFLIGARVADQLRASGMTQAAIGARLHLSRTAVNDRMTGRTRFTSDELPAIAHMLGMTLAELLGEDRRP